MKDKLKDLIETINLKTINASIKKVDGLVDWMNQTTEDFLPFDTISEQAYVILNDESPLCGNGNRRVFNRFSSGYRTKCHLPLSECLCYKESQSGKMKKATVNIDHEAANQKRKKTLKEKYGIDKLTDHPNWKTYQRLSDDILDKLTGDWLQVEYVDNKRTTVDIANELGIDPTTVNLHLRNRDIEVRRATNYSMIELQIVEYIQSIYSGDIRQHDYSYGFEIDILLPEKKLAIEVNGLYWHSIKVTSTTKKERERHLTKTLGFDGDMLHITDEDWLRKQDKIKNLIRSKLGINKRLYARKMMIKEVSSKDSKEFLEKYHIKGNAVSSIRYGLYNGNDLVLLATFGKPRFNKKYDFELIRLCSKDGINVIGGLSRIISHFKRFNSGSIISYCDRNRSSGNGYKAAGYTLIGTTEPAFVWNDGDNSISRLKASKSEMKKWIKTFDGNKSQVDNMVTNGYMRYYDCGQLIFQL